MAAVATFGAAAVIALSGLGAASSSSTDDHQRGLLVRPVNVPARTPAPVGTSSTDSYTTAASSSAAAPAVPAKPTPANPIVQPAPIKPVAIPARPLKPLPPAEVPNTSTTDYTTSSQATQAPTQAPPVKGLVKPKPRQPLTIGILDAMEPNAREAELGAEFQVVVKFQPVQQMRYPFLVKPYLDQGFQVVMVTEFLDPTLKTNLKEIGDGLYDAYLYEFVDELMNDGNREVWVRPMHEFNGDWYPWGTYMGGTNTIANFKRAWLHVHDVFTNKGANIKFQLAYNCENGQGSDTPFKAWWPGENYVDMVVCSGYNRAGSDPEHMVWQTFQEVYGPAYQQMADLPGRKPLGVGETSCTEFEDNDKHVVPPEQGRRPVGPQQPRRDPGVRRLPARVHPQGLPQNLPPLPPQVDVTGDGIINGDDAPPPPVAIDVNGDGVINQLDATQAPVNGATNPPAPAGVDLNGDGKIAGPAELPGDYNYDGVVDANDQLVAGMQGDFNGDGVIAGNAELPGDWNGDGVVDGNDVPPTAAPPAGGGGGVDLNGDGIIAGNAELPGDWNGDGVVDGNDVPPPAP
ncbi:hypothetical protein JKP88DRAFT_254751 [Tribonema minus]|uniref:GH26 domain-containing protein n=1 Tax=Tribonema minus TaxID=303371 RepID=A0A836CHJ5_9STRA|nr:hypothetical protein JKP88DRAFT_254751 [Tribonema minus]